MLVSVAAMTKNGTAIKAFELRRSRTTCAAPTNGTPSSQNRNSETDPSAIKIPIPLARNPSNTAIVATGLIAYIRGSEMSSVQSMSPVENDLRGADE